ncbi:XdhC family protein [Methylosinus sporium]|uniref:XdhC family protein n=1 Tax=Methylosinus sporium TaxID=428 RepID=UPI00383AF7E9
MASDDAEILLEAERWRREGRGVAIATVIETFGSAPRPVGSHLVVDDTGSFRGSVSAGCVEGDVISAALDVIADGTLRILEFGVADETAWRVGLSCGGRIAVLVQAVGAAAADVLAISNRWTAARRPHAIAIPLDGGDPNLPGMSDPLYAVRGVTLHDGRRWFVEWREPAPRLIVIGAVHIAQFLAPMARLTGIEPVIVDPRDAYAAPDRFPGVHLDLRWPDEALPEIGLDASTALVVLTHDPKIDDSALLLALASDCYYVGALGSRRTHARRIERLFAKGAKRDALARIRAPVGLDIGALGPAEIAVSVLGELIFERKRKPLRNEAQMTA